MQYDLAIIGGGPAGVAAGVYAARKQLKTVYITESFGGQSIESQGIENWIGTIIIPGADLARALENHLKAYAKDVVDIKQGERVTSVEKADEKMEKGFWIKTAKNNFSTKTVLVATGSSRRKLGVPGADIFEHKGLTYCASCDGPTYAGEEVVVVGGGNAGFESAAQLLAYCKSVTLLHKNAEFKADPVTVEKLKSNPKFKAITSVDILEVKGDKFVTGLTYKDNAGTNAQPITLPATGIFVEIGAFPATGFVKDLVELTPFGAIKVDPRTQETSVPGIWAAGDCTDGLYHQNNIACGDAIKALEDIYVHLHTK